MNAASSQVTEVDSNFAAFKKWRDRMNQPDTPPYEIIGALHYGKVFLEDGSDNQNESRLVRRQAISYYLWIANHFVNPKAPIFSEPEVEKKARSILTHSFFKISGDWKEWFFWKDLSHTLDNRLCVDLIDFLCCASEGIQQKVAWYKWNYWFIDTSLGANNEKVYREDRIISDFLSRMLWLLFTKEPANTPGQAVQDKLMQYRGLIIREIFLRAPWQLLPFVFRKEDIRFLEHIQDAYPEEYPRVFNPVIDDVCERIQNSPYVALPTRAEVLLILKSR